jgi:CRP-like cAMP-binding protein
MEPGLDVGEVTLGRGKAQARALADRNQHAPALFLYAQLLASFPLDDDLRVDVAEVLDHLGLALEARELYRTLGFHLANVGRPLRAVVCARTLAAAGGDDTGADAKAILELVAQAYAAGSPRLAAFAARPSPPDARAPVQLAPPPDDLQLSELATRVATRAGDLAAYPGYPPQLHPIPFLSELAPDSLQAVLQGLVLHQLADGQTVMRQGETGTSFYLVAGGELRVSVVAGDKPPRELARLHEGSLFGEMALITAQPRVASVTAVGPALVLEVTRQALDRVREQIPAVQQALDRFARERLIRNLLATSPLFTPFTKDQQAELLRRFEGVEVDPDTEIIRQGEQGRGLYVVLSGALQVSARPAGSTEEPVPLAVLGSGDIFGEMSLMTDEPTMATVRATSRCNLLFLARVYVQRLAEAIPEIGGYFAAVASRRAGDNSLRLGAAKLPPELIELDVSDMLLL